MTFEEYLTVLGVPDRGEYPVIVAEPGFQHWTAPIVIDLGDGHKVVLAIYKVAPNPAHVELTTWAGDEQLGRTWLEFVGP